MPTLYVENVPEDLYEALRARAQEQRQSNTAEVMTLLSENVPTAADLSRRKQLVARARTYRSKKPAATFSVIAIAQKTLPSAAEFKFGSGPVNAGSRSVWMKMLFRTRRGLPALVPA